MEGPTVGECIVEEWLRSLNLTHYTQAFLDNGYDDLEICKQIGTPDLDAIGVVKENHREEILNAVEALKNQSSTHVYFILEENVGNSDTDRIVASGGSGDGCIVDRSRVIEYDKYSDKAGIGHRFPNGNAKLPKIHSGDNSTGEDDNNTLTDEYAEGRRAFKTYPKLHLSAIIRGKLAKYEVNLKDKPYTEEGGAVNSEELQKLSQKYASELTTHPQDVLDRLHELLDLDAEEKEDVDHEGDDLSAKDGPEFSLYSVCSQTTRSVPPPLPRCPAPHHTSRHASFGDQGSPRHSSPSKSRSHSSESSSFRHLASLEEISVIDSNQENEVTRKPTDTLGRLLKAVTVKGKPAGKKYSYKQVKGDLNASEITMSEEERINIMFLVKEGKMTMDEALEMVKQYESEKRQELQQQYLESSSSTEACMFVVHSPTPSQKSSRSSTASKFSPFLLFKFGSHRRKKNSLSQGESSNSSLTSSPELSSKQQQQTRHYEGTGTQLYSPIHGLRKKITESTKPKSTGFFGSPKGSPIRSSKSKQENKIPAEYNIDTPKVKKKSSFSSPFSRRKKSATLSKGSLESNRASQNSMLDDSGVFDSPSSSRRGSLSNVLTAFEGRSKSPIPMLSRTMSQDYAQPLSSSPLSIQQETVAIVHYSPQRRKMMSSGGSSNIQCDSSSSSGINITNNKSDSDISTVNNTAAVAGITVDRLVSFKPFEGSREHHCGDGGGGNSSPQQGNVVISSHCKSDINKSRPPHAVSDSTVNTIPCSSSVPSSPKLKQSISSDNYEYAQHIDDYNISVCDSSSHHRHHRHSNKSSANGIEADFVCSECGGKHPKRTSHPLGYCIYVVKDSVSPKRRNSPSSTPPDSQSPKRQHISNSPDSTILTTQRKQGYTSPDETTATTTTVITTTTEISPTGTFESGSMKDGHYGSSSTMSVGSETSPSCTIERTTLKPVIKKLSKRTNPLDKQAPGVRIRSNSFSTGDEYLSSDQDDTLHKIPEKPRNQCKRHSMAEKAELETTENNMTSRDSNGHSEPHSDHSIEMPSDPERQQIVTAVKARTSSSGKSPVSLDDGTISKVGTQNRMSSRSPKTVDALLNRLGLQHLIPIFTKHGYTTLRSITDIEEGHLNQLVIWDVQDRAKLLTAAQMLSDYEDHLSLERSCSRSQSNAMITTTAMTSSAVTMSTSVATNASPCSHSRSLHPSNLLISTSSSPNDADNNQHQQQQQPPLPSPPRTNASKRENRLSTGSYTSTTGGSAENRPLYENIDNFENAIPMRELVLCHRGCQSDFDLAGAMESLQSSSTSGCYSQEDIVHSSELVQKHQEQNHGDAENSITSQCEDVEAVKEITPINNTTRIRPQCEDDETVKEITSSNNTTRIRPQVPERTVSLPDPSPIESGKYKTIGAKTCRDASTQHGGILQMLKKRSSTGSLLKSSPISSTAKVKTAEVRHLISPQNFPYVKEGTSPNRNYQQRQSSTLPRLCSHHKKIRHTSDSIMKSVHKKLHMEAIDLTNRPYTLVDGSCGVPVLLVQRYAEELQADLYDIATSFETIRTKALQGQARETIINSDLGDQCLSPTEEPRLSSVHDFLISIGLPMYTPLIVSQNVHTVEQLVNNIHTEDLVRIGITDPAHIRRLRHWMQKLRHPISSSQHGSGSNKHVKSSVQDKV